MIGKKTNNPYRWVKAQVIMSGNPAGQYPLPVSKQGIRAEFTPEVPIIVPAYFLLGVGGMPRWSKDADGKTTQTIEEYRFETVEIDEKYQSEEGIRKFIEECAERGSELNQEYGPLKLGVEQMPPEMKVKPKPKASK